MKFFSILILFVLQSTLSQAFESRSYCRIELNKKQSVTTYFAFSGSKEKPRVSVSVILQTMKDGFEDLDPNGSVSNKDPLPFTTETLLRESYTENLEFESENKIVFWNEDRSQKIGFIEFATLEESQRGVTLYQLPGQTQVHATWNCNIIEAAIGVRN